MKRFVPGQKIRRLPGGSLNMALDLVGKQGRFGPPPGPGDRPPTFDTPVLVVPCKNMSGVALPERAIVGVDVSAFTPPDITPGTPDSNDANEAILRGVPVEIVKPNATTHASKWGVTLGPMGTTAPHNVGHLVITGLVWARVNVTDAAHKCVTLTTDDTTYLASAASGTAIWDRKLAGTGKQWALILLGGGGSGGTSAETCLLKATANIPAASGTPRAAGTSTDYDVILGSDPGVDIQNWSLVEITSGSYMFVIKIGSDPVIVSAFC